MHIFEIFNQELEKLISLGDLDKVKKSIQKYMDILGI
jgi:hypothetical protein